MVERSDDLKSLPNKDLHLIAGSPTQEGHVAFEELAGRAFGGNVQAQRLTLELEGRIMSGALIYPEKDGGKTEKTLPKKKGILQVIISFMERTNRQSGNFVPPDRDP